MFPALALAVPSRRRAVLGVATALMTFGPVAAAEASTPSFDAQASARLQVQAEFETKTAARLAATAKSRAVQALHRAGNDLNRARDLAVSAVDEGEAAVSAEVAVRFAQTFSDESVRLTALVGRTNGRLQQRAAELAREASRLNAEVTAAVASRADLGADAELTASLGAADQTNVEAVEALVAASGSTGLGARTRGLLTQAAGATVIMRGAVSARLSGLRTAALATATVTLDRTLQGVRAGSERLADEIRSLMPVVGADMSVSAEARFPGLSVAASALACLSGSRVALKAVMRAV